jgi:hypothetical protein
MTMFSRARGRAFCVLAALATGVGVLWTSGSPVAAKSPDSAPALAMSGTVVNVSSVSALQSAVANVKSNQTIVIAPGTYNLTSTLWINGTFSNVTVRGATNNRDDVVLMGKGMGVASDTVPFGIWSGGNVTNLTIANLTIRDVYQHPIMLNPGTHKPHIYNVHLINAGEQFIKSNPNGDGTGVESGIVEYSVLEYTNTAPSDYTNGVDVHGGTDWIIRNNLFRRIRAPQGQLAGPAILMWRGSKNSTADGNTFIDCQREISFGLAEQTPNDHSGGIIRNNFIYRSQGAGGDVAIAAFDSPGTKIVHNTIFLNGQYPNAIEARFPNTTGVMIVNNLADRAAQLRDGATAAQSGNVWTAASSWFVNPAAGDLHLKSTATSAIDRGVANSDAPLDWDGGTRPVGGNPDVGADEYTGNSASAADTTAPSVSVTSPKAGAVVSGTVALGASASDNVGVASVWFTVDNATVGGEDPSAPYGINWTSTSVANGSHVIRALARDAAGNARTSSPVTVTVQNGTSTPPPSTPSSPVSCTTTKPVSNWVCVNGGWLPPDHPLAIAAGLGSPPAAPPPSTPPPSTPPPSTPPPTTSCTTAKPVSNWICVNGGWLPPDHPLAIAAMAGGGASSGSTTPPPSTPPPSQPSTTTLPACAAGLQPASPVRGWVRVNGGWVPPDHPLAAQATCQAR